MHLGNLTESDPQIASLIDREYDRQNQLINLIPSENITSAAVREAVGSVLMHKYSEGNIGKRYYEGNEFIDEIEKLAISRAKQLFKLPEDWDVNVQALSGSYANLAVYLAMLKPGDTIMSMYLPDGGHLSHGWSYEPGRAVNAADPVYLPGSRRIHVVSKLFNIVQYKTDPQTNLLDYDAIESIAKEHNPRMIVTGGTAYPRDIDYGRMRDIAHEVGAYYHADIAHEAGLIGAGSLPSPVGIADVVTLTTHKTLRSARGSLILAHQDVIEKVNKAVLPGIQGGPFNNNIAGIAVGLREALQPEFKEYTDQVIKNAKKLGAELKKRGYDIVSGGTDKHLILVNLENKGVGGKAAAKALAAAGIIANMNTVPGEKKSPANPSGVRFGTPFVTSQGLSETHMSELSEFIDSAISTIGTKNEVTDLKEIRERVMKFTAQNFNR